MRLRVRRQYSVLVLILLLCGAAAANADGSGQGTSEQETATTLKSLSLEQLSNIEVTTTTKGPESAFRTPAAVYVITGEDIARSGVTTIPDALRLAPGVEVAQIDSSKWSVGIRGFGSRLSRSVLVLIDGRTVYTTLLAGTYWEVQDTVLEDVDRIEVIRGPGGTIWGPNAVNGVINIITKAAKDTRGEMVSVGGGNVAQGFVNVRHGGGNGKGFNYRVYGKTFERGPMDHPDAANFDDWRSAQGGFRMDWQHRDRDAFTVQGDLYIQEGGERVVATSYTAPFSRTIDAIAQLSGGNILGRWTRTFNAGNDIQVQAYYDRTNRHEPNFGELRNTFDADFTQHVKAGGRNSFTWGLGARFSHGNDIQVVSGLTFSPSERTDKLLTAFVQDEIAIVDRRLALTLGTKLLHTNFTGFAAEPSARLLWTPSEKTSFWAAITHAVRTPSDAERDFFLSGFIGLAPDGTPFFARFNANRNFVPEQLEGYELGYRQLFTKKLLVDVATYYNHYRDLFSQEITGAPFIENTPSPTHLMLPARFGNGLQGQTKGIEIAPEWRPTNFWRLRGSYSYLKMNLEKSPGSLDVGSAPGIMGGSPQHQATAQSSFDLPKAVSFDINYRYVSELAAQAVASYSTADARVAWRFTKGLEIAVLGQNLLQPRHGEFAGDPSALVGIKRSVYVKLTWVRGQ